MASPAADPARGHKLHGFELDAFGSQRLSSGAKISTPKGLQIQMRPVIRRKGGIDENKKPEILAPAGNRKAFLAALAAGADAIYCGLRSFSARMAAKNFTLEQLAGLVELAHARKTRVYLAFNNLLTTAELDQAARTIDILQQAVKPDALIIQDMALLEIVKQTGFSGQVHLSTLANVSFPGALKRLASVSGASRVVIPRELSIDEIKAMAADCPSDLGLEVFVHGALCYAVSGRCYWSSYLGGKSGLRGWCVQPCRRRYQQDGTLRRFFACLDLSADVLTKVLLKIPAIRAWKIEGRKKGAHYVYYTTCAYRILRDQSHDPQAKKEALGLLEMALGRPGTHYNLLGHRPQSPLQAEIPTGSGLLVARLRGTGPKAHIQPRLPLLAGDSLRIGFEDDPWHCRISLSKSVPKGGTFHLTLQDNKKPPRATPVFLVDRSEAALEEKLRPLQEQLVKIPSPTRLKSAFVLRLPTAGRKHNQPMQMKVLRRTERRLPRGATGLWLEADGSTRLPKGNTGRIWWWLPPVIWPENQEDFLAQLQRLLAKGARRFVLNAPWQIAWFKNRRKLALWAGPFCNVANPLAARSLKLMGFNGVILSPELGRRDFVQMAAKSPLPTGMVIRGNWPLCVSRIVPPDLKLNHPFTSPKGEKAWTVRRGGTYWTYPNWPIDLTGHQETLFAAGIGLFVHLEEPLPRSVAVKQRPGLWNWEAKLR